MAWSMMAMPILAFLMLNVALVQCKAQLRGSVDACVPSPCGPNTECSINSVGAAVCRCLPGMFPKPDTITGCGPQCTQDYECKSNERCFQNKCQGACVGDPCGVNTECEALNHRAVCRCYRGYTGDPLIQCTQQAPISRAIISQPPPQAIAVRARDPCAGAPCGQNAECRSSGDRPVCSCPAGYQGNPQILCRRGECSANSECPSFQVCQNFHCVNPCSNACAPNAQCEVRNHIAVCSCPQGFKGDATRSCQRADLCQPSPCGANTKCRVENERAICSCLQSYIGDPISGCRHECEIDSECPSQQSCVNFKCKNPCVNFCGTYASCEVRNHRAICRCPEDYLGDPYTKCFPECTSHADCPANRACIGLKCGDPCSNACGTNAECRVDKANHKAICSCPKGYTGHPFDQCRRQTPADLCQPNPCGQNAICTPGYDNSGRDRPVCTCPAGYIGDALINCKRGECTTDSECPNNRICSNFNCKNPCDGACGVNAQCEARNHGAVCSCPGGYKGDPFYQCSYDPVRAKRKADEKSGIAEGDKSDDKEVEVPDKLE